MTPEFRKALAEKTAEKLKTNNHTVVSAMWEAGKELSDGPLQNKDLAFFLDLLTKHQSEGYRVSCAGPV